MWQKLTHTVQGEGREAQVAHSRIEVRRGKYTDERDHNFHQGDDLATCSHRLRVKSEVDNSVHQ